MITLRAEGEAAGSPFLLACSRDSCSGELQAVSHPTFRSRIGGDLYPSHGKWLL